MLGLPQGISRRLAARRARRAERRRAWEADQRATLAYLERRARELEASGLAEVTIAHGEVGASDPSELSTLTITPTAPGAAAIDIDFGPGPWYFYLEFPPESATDGEVQGPVRFAEMFGALDEAERFLEGIVEGRLEWTYKPPRTTRVRWLDEHDEPTLTSTSYLGLKQGHTAGSGRIAPYDA